MSIKNFKIKTAIEEDAESIFAVQKETWLVTYPNAGLGITREAIGQRFANTDSRVEKWKQMINDPKTMM